jgi:hypothetical protein
VNHQITRFIARNAHPIRIEPKLGRNAHGLAVAMIEDAGCEGFHCNKFTSDVEQCNFDSIAL